MIRPCSMKLLTAALLPAALLCFARATKSESTSFSGPTLGFLASSDTELRPILGIPGASHLGSVVPLPASVTKLHIAPGAAYAIVEQSGGNPLGIMQLRVPASGSDLLSVKAVADAPTQVNAVTFSPNGEVAAIYSESANLVYVLTGLPHSVQVSHKLGAGAITGAVRKLAVSDDGGLVLAADSSAVYSLQPGSAAATVSASADISALIFLPNSHDAVACDRSQNTVALLSSVTSSLEVSTLSNKISDPEAASSSADGKTIFIASPSQPRIWTIDRASGLTKFYPTTGNPAQFTSLSTKDVFLISPPGSDTYWVLSWKGVGLTTSFIGAPREASTAWGSN